VAADGDQTAAEAMLIDLPRMNEAPHFCGASFVSM
jgi:hypothetical protein